VALLRQRGCDVNLVIIGSISDEEWYREIVANQKDPSWIIQMGGIDDEEKSRVLAVTDVVLLLSTYEAYGFVAVEALVHGAVPVLWSDFPSAPELVKRGAVAAERQDGAEGVAAAILNLAGQNKDNHDPVKNVRTWAEFAEDVRVRLLDL
jgi:glycosyltransferase involved in cell wall biosynthesis